MKSSLIITNEAQRDRALGLIASLDLTRPMKVTIEKFVKKRSPSQNRLYHDWVDLMCEHFGYEKHEMKDELSEMFMPASGRRMGTSMDGAPKEFRSSTWLSKQEFSDYLNAVDRFAASYGVILPHPSDMQRR